MKKVERIILIAILSLMFSCSVLKPLSENNQRVVLDNSNLSMLDGTYYEGSTDTVQSNPTSLYFSFFLKGKIDYDDHYKGEEFIRLKVLSPKKIRVSLIREDSAVESRISKGRIKNNTFVFNRRWKVLPIIFSNSYRDSKIRVSLLQNGNLGADAKTMVYGNVFLVIPIFNVEQKYNMEFKRIK